MSNGTNYIFAFLLIKKVKYKMKLPGISWGQKWVILDGDWRLEPKNDDRE